MGFVNDHGTLLHVVRDGTRGPAVLFVQGLAGAWFDWDPVVPLLADDHRLVRCLGDGTWITTRAGHLGLQRWRLPA